MSSEHIRFDESGDSFDSSDNDENLMNVISEKNDSDGKEDVYGVYSDNGSSDIAMSDVEDQADDDIPDIRAWGKEKQKFYSTDYVDKDYNTYQGKDALLADLEEEEAKNLQLQLVQQLQDTDFPFDILPKQSKEDISKIEETVVTDISKLTKRQKLDIFRTDAPEFYGLIEDSKEKFITIKAIFNLLKSKKSTNRVINEKKTLEFLNKHLQLILNYLVNISVYLLLKSQKVAIKTHPVIKRLYQFRQLLNEMEHVFHQITNQEIGKIPSEYQGTQNKSGSKLKSKLDTGIRYEENPVRNQVDVLLKSKVDTNEITEIKRPISYQIAKNKGLLPHRKKEQRNPRVKNRIKYRKAKIRRKGAVREVRKELTRYSGEISGIKATVKKSISIKS